MIKLVFISAPSAQARDIAEILKVSSMIPQTTIDVGLGFESPAQAGQYQRRIREALVDAHVDPDAFTFVRPKDSSALEIVYVGAADDDCIPAAASQMFVAPVETPIVPLPVPTRMASGSFTEGKAVLQDLAMIEKASGSYVEATFLIVEGHEKGQSIPESLRRFPPHARLHRVAQALRVAAEELTSRPAKLIGSPVWVRRRRFTLPNGTPKVETLYYPVAPALVNQPIAV